MSESIKKEYDGCYNTEIGTMPNDWGITTLGDMFEVQQGKGMSPKHRRGISPYPFLRTSNVLWGKVDVTNLDYMDFNENERNKLKLSPGDLLICEGGETGKTAIWEGEVRDCFYQNHIYRLRCKESNIEPYFVMYWMQAALKLLNLYSGHETKTTIPNLSSSRLKLFKIPNPPLHEQRNIAHILSTIQQAIEATDKVITAAQELKKSLMQHLFTYGPVSLEETEQIPLKETEMGMIPEHWEIMPLEELVFKSFSGGTPTTKNPEYWNGTINWTTSAYIEGLYLNKAPKNISEIGLKNSSSQIVPKNNIIVGTRVGVGKVAINNIDVAISQDLTGLIIDKSKIELDYLAYALLTDIIQNKFTSNTRGTTIRGISRKDLMQIFVHVPPLQEQKNVAYYLSIVDKRIEVEKDKKVQLQSLFNSMLHHLMTGKLRVKDLDLNIPEEVAQ